MIVPNIYKSVFSHNHFYVAVGRKTMFLHKKNNILPVVLYTFSIIFEICEMEKEK